MDRESFNRFLDEGGVPRTFWGRTGHGGKTDDDLFRETEQDGVRLYRDRHGRTIAKRTRAFIHAEYVNARTGRKYKLEEKARVFPDGSFDDRFFSDPSAGSDEERPSFSETMRPGETAEDAGLRGVQQELSLPTFPKGRIKLLGYVAKAVRKSRTYEGIWSEEEGWELVARLRKRDCEKLYFERGDDGVITLIGWRGDMPPHILRKRLKRTLSIASP
jgi:hypothetical protein